MYGFGACATRVCWATALVGWAATAVLAWGALVAAPGTGTPSKMVLSHFCFVGPEQPATRSKQASNPMSPERRPIAGAPTFGVWTFWTSARGFAGGLGWCDLFRRIKQPSAREVTFWTQIRKR